MKISPQCCQAINQQCQLIKQQIKSHHLQLLCVTHAIIAISILPRSIKTLCSLISMCGTQTIISRTNSTNHKHELFTSIKQGTASQPVNTKYMMWCFFLFLKNIINTSSHSQHDLVFSLPDSVVIHVRHCGKKITYCLLRTNCKDDYTYIAQQSSICLNALILVQWYPATEATTLMRPQSLCIDQIIPTTSHLSSGQFAIIAKVGNIDSNQCTSLLCAREDEREWVSYVYCEHIVKTFALFLMNIVV